MLRFLFFVGLLVAAAYLLTAPPKQEMALSTSQARALGDKPLLTSWGRTLASLRDAPRAPTQPAQAPDTQTASTWKFNQYGEGTELWVLGKTNGWKAPAGAAQDRGWMSDSYVETASGRFAPNQDTRAAISTKRQPLPETQLAAARLSEERSAKPVEPAIDPIAGVKPSERRGLFGRSKTKRQTSNAKRADNSSAHRGIFARLKGRSQPVQRPWAVGRATVGPAAERAR